jgi:aconitate hydratase
MKKYQSSLKIGDNNYQIFDIKTASEDAGFDLSRLPYSLRILFENVSRLSGAPEKLAIFKEWLKNKKSDSEIDFMPARVLMQDFTGVPAVVDLAAMRDALKELKGDPLKINPLIDVDLVIDHSVQVDSYASPNSFDTNVKMEVERNEERYEFLKWGQENFNNFRVVPPGTGICHQVNLEYLAQVIYTKKQGNEILAYPDSLVGTDSHTTMVNGLAVLGWGVGGIEAEAAMLGSALPMILPEVVGFKLTGSLQGIITATDLVLTVTQMLRQKGVVGKFVEFFGEGVAHLSLADRATISNMSPEYGATCGFFPIDAETLRYLKFTGRSEGQVELVEKYAKIQGLWLEVNNKAEYSDIIELDLTTLETSLAGPRRPQDRVSLSNAAANFQLELPSLAKGGADINKTYAVAGKDYTLNHGKVVIAAITSCTNTSNPYVMVGAGLLAKKACELGLTSKPWVKTSLAPGSKVVTEYLKSSGLDVYLDRLGFNLVGYGCTTCIGNSGPLKPEIEESITKNQLVVASVLSGNRNFEGRIHPLVRANYLASPPLVVAYALAGDISVNLSKEPVGKDKTGKDIYLHDIWPTQSQIKEYVDKFLNPKMFTEKYSNLFEGDENWRKLKTSKTSTYQWDSGSSYIKNPPYFSNIKDSTKNLHNINSAHILAVFGDSITTDHISPAGSIAVNGPAGKYLMDLKIDPKDFNSYGARRGNHEVMMRGTFANTRIKNQICPGTEGGVTTNYLNNKQMSIYDAAMDYKAHDVPLVIFAGAEYGSGSSRDWAAKGPALLGVKAIIASGFERIHRANLAGMGILPIIFKDKITTKDLNLDGSEIIDILGLDDNIKPHQHLTCAIKRKNGKTQIVNVVLQILTDNEIDYIKHGSIMHDVIRKQTR